MILKKYVQKSGATFIFCDHHKWNSYNENRVCNFSKVKYLIFEITNFVWRKIEFFLYLFYNEKFRS